MTAPELTEALFRATWQASVLVAFVLVAQWILGAKLPARWRYNLWLIVLVRLALPITPSSRLSVYNFIPHRSPPPVPVATVHFPTYTVTLPATPTPRLERSSRPVPVARVQPERSIDWRHALQLAWLTGSLLLAARVAWTTVALHRAARRLTPVGDGSLLKILGDARVQLDIRRHIELLPAPFISSPALMGVFRPRLLVPPDILKRFDGNELRLIFLHELAHLRRNDVAVNWLMTLLLLVHWFNPIVWLALARMRSDRELACDELVLLATQQTDRRIYGHTILKLLENLSRPAAAPGVPGMVGILENPHLIRRRITMIAAFERRSRRWAIPAVVAMVAIGCVALTDSTKDKPQSAPVAASGVAVSDATTSPTTAPAPRMVETARIREKLAQAQREMDRASGPTAERRTALDEKMVALQSRLSEAAQATSRANASLVLNSHNRQDPFFSRQDDSPEQVMARLQKRIPEVRFDNVPLRDVLDFFRDATELNLIVSHQALESAGIDMTTPISLRLRDITGEQFLRQIARQAAGGNSTKVGFGIDGNTIVFSTEEDANRYLMIRAYNIEDLALSATTQPDLQGQAAAIAALCTVIVNNVTPNEWRDAGGSTSNLSVLGTTVIITAPATTQFDVQQLLSELRSAHASRGSYGGFGGFSQGTAGFTGSPNSDRPAPLRPPRTIRTTSAPTQPTQAPAASR